MNRKSYPSDFTDAQWQKRSRFCQPLKWEICLIINAIFYVVKSGCQRCMLPHSMAPCQLEIASTLGQQWLEVAPLRWIVERTFYWFRLSALDYERYPKTAEIMA